MEILVLGAGGIGSLYGARLSQHNDVVLICRKEHADKINKNGLKITGLENKTYRLKAATKIEKIEDNTLILLTTKVYDSAKAINSIKKITKKSTTILCLQNGLYSENIVKGIAGKKCLVLRGITNVGAVFLEPGIVQYNGRSYTLIEKSPRSKEISDSFSNSGLDCNISGNIKADMWRKLILNCVLNPVSAILRVENSGVADENLNPLKKLIVDECLKVARKDGVSFDIDFVKKMNEGIKNSKNLSSMLQDLLKGKQTEIDYLNGAVAKLGKSHGVECPVNKTLTMVIKQMEKRI